MGYYYKGYDIASHDGGYTIPGEPVGIFATARLAEDWIDANGEGVDEFEINEIERLTVEYGEWLKANDLPEMSADELINETVEIADGEERHICNDEQRNWLRDFIDRWDVAQDAEMWNWKKGDA